MATKVQIQHNRKPIRQQSTRHESNVEPIKPANSLAAIQQAITDPSALSATDVTRLQHVLGNRAVDQLITNRPQPARRSARPILQARLTIGPAGDPYEQEADRIARRVVRRTAAAPEPMPSAKTSLQRQTQDDEELPEDDLLLQRKAVQVESVRLKPGVTQVGPGGGDTGSELETSIQHARGSGQPLPETVRGRMEHGFGADFSGVKLHLDAQSDQLNRSIQAKAFTTGQDIFFRRGAYNPGSPSGQELIAHELTHVMQQNGSALRPKRLDPATAPAKSNRDSQIGGPARREAQWLPSRQLNRKALIQRVILDAKRSAGHDTAANLINAAKRFKGHPERIGPAMVTMEQKEPGYLNRKIASYIVYINGKNIGDRVQTPQQYFRMRSATKRGIRTERGAIKKSFGAKKNKTHFRVYYGPGPNDYNERIPDAVTSTTIADIKNVKKLEPTDQLKDFEKIAHRSKHPGVKVTQVASTGTEKNVNKDREFVVIVRSSKHPEGATEVSLVIHLLADKVEESLIS